MKILHKRSNQLVDGSAKQPETSVVEYGELVVNFNTDDPTIFLKDSADNIVRIASAGAVKAYPGYGIAIESEGIRIGDDWSAIPTLT